MSLIRIAAVAALVLLTGCAQIRMTPPQPSIEAAQQLRQADIVQVQVGPFQPGANDKSIAIRGGNSVSAAGDSFAAYLRETLLAELQGAGLVREGADAVITGQLLDSQLDAGAAVGSGSLKARFVVTRGGQQRYARELSVSARWESSFIGAVAIPLAAGQYQGLYRQLVLALIQDPAFRQALARP